MPISRPSTTPAGPAVAAPATMLSTTPPTIAPAPTASAQQSAEPARRPRYHAASFYITPLCFYKATPMHGSEWRYGMAVPPASSRAGAGEQRPRDAVEGGRLDTRGQPADRVQDDPASARDTTLYALRSTH